MAFRAVVRQARRVVVFVIGATVLLLGVVMVVGPGPGLVTVAAGLAILAVEFAWAKRLLERGRTVAGQQTERFAPAWAKRWLEKARRMVTRQPGRDIGEGAGQGVPDGVGGGGKVDDGAKKEEERKT